MSVPSYIRYAISACKPVRTRALLPRPGHYISQRTYANFTEDGETDTQAARAQQVASSLPDAPPKRTPPATAHLAPSSDEPQAQHPTNTIAASSSEVYFDGDEESAIAETEHIVPPNVLAAYRVPLRHPRKYGVPVASLQLRSYSVRNLEFFADFAMRAAYYLNLPASGPVPLPKRIERWTVIRGNFVHKKNQENFERITLKRLITVYDGEKSAVEAWLAFIRKHQFYGVGMKANVWEFEGLDVAKKMDSQMSDLEAEINAKLANFGFNKSVADQRNLDDLMKAKDSKVGSPSTYVRPQAARWL